MNFDLIGEIVQVEFIAKGNSFRDIKSIRKQFGPGRWRKLKGIATVRVFGGTIRRPRFIGTKHMALVNVK